MKRKPEPARMNVSFPDGQKVQPDGFKSISVCDTVTFTVQAKVMSIASNAEEWSPGKHITADIKRFSIETPDAPMSMNAAISATKAPA